MTSSKPPRIGLISGSLRTGSINKQLITAMKSVFKEAGARTAIIDLADYELPLYNGDFHAQNGVPKAVKNLVSRLKRFDGIFIATPEYNGGLPPLVKNTIDWSTMLSTDHFSGPAYAIGSCTPGAMSGIMVLRQMNFILARLGATVMPVHLGVGNAETAFDNKGRLADPRTLALAEKLAKQMMRTIAQRSALND